MCRLYKVPSAKHVYYRCSTTYILQKYELHVYIYINDTTHILHMYHTCNTHVVHLLVYNTYLNLSVRDLHVFFY